MRYIFPETITDLTLAKNLPCGTVVEADGMRCRYDGASVFTVLNGGSKVITENLLNRGPIVVKSLPEIPEEEQAATLFRHVLFAVRQRRDDLDENAAGLMTVPEFLATRERANPGAYAVASGLSLVDILGGFAWIDDRLAELDIDRATAKDLHSKYSWSRLQERIAEYSARNAPEATDPVTAAIHAELVKHSLRAADTDGEDSWTICWCGDEVPGLKGSSNTDEELDHHASHQSEALAAALRTLISSLQHDAWQQGRQSGHDHMIGKPSTNPYPKS